MCEDHQRGFRDNMTKKVTGVQKSLKAVPEKQESSMKQDITSQISSTLSNLTFQMVDFATKKNKVRTQFLNGYATSLTKRNISF